MSKRLKVDWCSYEAAKFAVLNWHYSKSMPSSKLAKFGVWEDDQFIGAVIYGVGATRTLVKPYGLMPHQGCELVRVALTDHDAPVSKIVAVTLRMLKRRYLGLRLVISFADPFQGHRGGIYQAGNWAYLGETAKDRFPMIDGKVVHPRTVSDMVKRGTIKNRRALRYVDRPGKHRYGYPLDEAMRGVLDQISKPYPHASEVGDVSTPGEQRRCDSDPDAPLL